MRHTFGRSPLLLVLLSTFLALVPGVADACKPWFAPAPALSEIMKQQLVGGHAVRVTQDNLPGEVSDAAYFTNWQMADGGIVQAGTALHYETLKNATGWGEVRFHLDTAPAQLAVVTQAAAARYGHAADRVTVTQILGQVTLWDAVGNVLQTRTFRFQAGRNIVQFCNLNAAATPVARATIAVVSANFALSEKLDFTE